MNNIWYLRNRALLIAEVELFFMGNFSITFIMKCMIIYRQAILTQLWNSQQSY